MPLHAIDAGRREQLIKEIEGVLHEERDIIFGYVYGSILESDAIHDVDVGVYLGGENEEGQTRRAVELAARLTVRLGLPVDMRVLNRAPVTFLYHVLRGRLICNRDDERLTDIMEETARQYFDIAPLLRHYTKEAFGSDPQC